VWLYIGIEMYSDQNRRLQSEREREKKKFSVMLLLLLLFSNICSGGDNRLNRQSLHKVLTGWACRGEVSGMKFPSSSSFTSSRFMEIGVFTSFCLPSGWPDWANFGQLGDYFSLGSFFVENFGWSQKIYYFFYTEKCYILLLPKNDFGYILGDFFINSSGHPVYRPSMPASPPKNRFSVNLIIQNIEGLFSIQGSLLWGGGSRPFFKASELGTGVGHRNLKSRSKIKLWRVKSIFILRIFSWTVQKGLILENKMPFQVWK
jgi:hypothetical protein